MENEIRTREERTITGARAFADYKKDEMRKKARKDNEELFSMEKKNIEREIRQGEEKIREEYLLSLVQVKSAFIDEVWKSARRRFLSMPKRKAEYKKFMGKVFASVKNIRDYQVFLRKEDMGFHKGAMRKSMAGGAIFRSRDGKIEIDHSLEGIAERCREETKAKISEVLFG